MIYILNKVSAIKKMKSKNAEILSIKIIVAELDLLKKTVIIQKTSENKIYYHLQPN